MTIFLLLIQKSMLWGLAISLRQFKASTDGAERARMAYSSREDTAAFPVLSWLPQCNHFIHHPQFELQPHMAIIIISIHSMAVVIHTKKSWGWLTAAHKHEQAFKWGVSFKQQYIHLSFSIFDQSICLKNVVASLNFLLEFSLPVLDTIAIHIFQSLDTDDCVTKSWVTPNLNGRVRWWVSWIW